MPDDAAKTHRLHILAGVWRFAATMHLIVVLNYRPAQQLDSLHVLLYSNIFPVLGN